MGEDDHIYWQDALDAIKGGHLDKVGKCPFCYTGELKVTRDERKTKVMCMSCRQFIEGRFSDE